MVPSPYAPGRLKRVQCTSIEKHRYDGGRDTTHDKRGKVARELVKVESVSNEAPHQAIISFFQINLNCHASFPTFLL